MAVNKKNKIEAEDLLALYDRIWNQFKEDRDAIVSQYNELREILKANPDKYMILGDTLAKSGDLMLKQTAQIIELAKIAGKKKEDDGELTKEDLEEIKQTLDDDQKQQQNTVVAESEEN